jgi:hypothetical protein
VSSTAIKTRGLIRICPGLASSHSLDATSFEAHGAERGMSMRYADAEAKVVT